MRFLNLSCANINIFSLSYWISFINIYSSGPSPFLPIFRVNFPSIPNKKISIDFWSKIIICSLVTYILVISPISASLVVSNATYLTESKHLLKSSSALLLTSNLTVQTGESIPLWGEEHAQIIKANAAKIKIYFFIFMIIMNWVWGTLWYPHSILLANLALFVRTTSQRTLKSTAFYFHSFYRRRRAVWNFSFK